jgi:hypothetical protein
MTTTVDGTLNESPGGGRTRLSTTWVLILALLLGAVAGFAGGFAASALHPGPKGDTGAQGARGPIGHTGLQGESGAAAQVTDLGVCYNSTSQTSADGSTFWITGVYITSPLRHPDGTTFCSVGSYIPVSPQAAIGG